MTRGTGFQPPDCSRSVPKYAKRELRDLKAFNYPESTFDLLGISTNHFSSAGKRLTFDSNASISLELNLTPLEYAVSIRVPSGCFPFHVIVRAKPNTASIESSSDPFQ